MNSSTPLEIAQVSLDRDWQLSSSCGSSQDKAYLIYRVSFLPCSLQISPNPVSCMARVISNTGLAMKSLAHLLSLSSHLTANRETAFVHAISSAGVMYTLTRNCSLGDFDNCGCDDSRNGQLGKDRQAGVPLSRPRLQEEALLSSTVPPELLLGNAGWRL